MRKFFIIAFTSVLLASCGNNSQVFRKYIEEEGMVQDYEIDHYNNIVSGIHEWNINEDDSDPLFPSHPPIVDYDILDAYEGDEANRWNTD